MYYHKVYIKWDGSQKKWPTGTGELVLDLQRIVSDLVICDDGRRSGHSRCVSSSA